MQDKWLIYNWNAICLSVRTNKHTSYSMIQFHAQLHGWLSASSI